MNPRAGLLTVCVLAFTGCAGSLLDSNVEAPVTYRLEGEALAERGGRLPLAIGVARLRSAPSLETERIAVLRPDSRFDYFTGVRWAEPATQMLQQLLVRALAADGRFEAVVAAPSRVPADLLLDVELRRFEAVYSTDGAAPTVRVEMQLALIDPRKAQRVASFVAAGSAAAAENRQDAVIAAFERATAEAVRAAAGQVREAAPAASR
jgi:cholesterol transport system auxiliary component